MVNFAEAIGPARSFAAAHKYKMDPNQELIGLGAANFGAGVFQGFPIGSSLSKSAANERAGAHSQMSGIIAAGVTVVVALFFAQFFYALPEAALGAIVIVAVSGMVKVAKIRHLYQVRRSDFALAFSSNGRFLYAISGGSSTISSFLFRADGSLMSLGTLDVPAGSLGLAAH